MYVGRKSHWVSLRLRRRQSTDVAIRVRWINIRFIHFGAVFSHRFYDENWPRAVPKRGHNYAEKLVHCSCDFSAFFRRAASVREHHNKIWIIRMFTVVVFFKVFISIILCFMKRCLSYYRKEVNFEIFINVVQFYYYRWAVVFFRIQ